MATVMTTSDTLLDVNEVARRLHLSRRSIYRLVDSGQLPALRFHPEGRLRFRPQDVAELIERAREER